MKNPKITVFIAAYNVGNFIAESISSILNQTFKDYELLIVNDGATDNTVKVIEGFKDERIKLIHNDGNKGLPYTRNRLLELAKGEYIAILDGDDIAYPDRLEIQANFLDANPDIALCGGHGKTIDKNGIETNIRELIVPTDDYIDMHMLFGNPFVNSTTMFKTEVFKELNGYRDFDLAEDFDLFIRISEKYKVANINQLFVKYRIHDNNITLERSKDQYNNEMRIIKDMQLSLGMAVNNDFLALHEELFTKNLNKNSISKYLQLFEAMKLANDKTKRFQIDKFDNFIFNKWYEILKLQKSNKKVLSFYFRKELFNWSYLNFKQFRKILKISLRGLVN